MLSERQKYLIIGVRFIGGVGLHFCLNRGFNKTGLVTSGSSFHRLISLMWYMPEISKRPVQISSLIPGGSGIKYLEAGWLEHYGARGGSLYFLGFSGVFQIRAASFAVVGCLLRVILVFIFVVIY